MLNFIEELLTAVGLVLIGLVLCITFSSTIPGIWKVWKYLIAATVGLIVGTIVDMQLICALIAIALYMLFGWKWSRKLLFGSWKKTLITIGVIIIGLFLCRFL